MKREDKELKEILNNSEIKIEKPIIDKEDRSEKFVRAIPEALLEKCDFDSKKAYLTTKNENGILKAKAINTFTNLNFGFENNILISLEEKKKEISLSVKGRGIDKIIDYGKAFGYQVISEDEGGLTKGIIRRR